MKNLTYRPNIGMLLVNKKGKVLVAERYGMSGVWQLPQGGVDDGEEVIHALCRETKEELGIDSNLYRVIAVTPGWIYYKVPYWEELAKSNSKFRGQKQKWFLLEFLGVDDDIKLDSYKNVEFSDWRWVSYWYPLTITADFKLNAYRRALSLLLASYREFMINK